MSRFFIAILLFMILFACKSGIPKDIIQPTEMESVLFDIHVVDGYTSIYTGASADSLKKIISPYYKGVYKKHRIDSMKYQRSLDYYYQHPELLKNMYENISRKLAAARDKASKAQIKEEEARAKKVADRLKKQADSIKKEAEKAKQTAAKFKEAKVE